MTAGYTEALRKTEEIGEEEVNKNRIYIKFVCAAEVAMMGDAGAFCSGVLQLYDVYVDNYLLDSQSPPSSWLAVPLSKS